MKRPRKCLTVGCEREKECILKLTPKVKGQMRASFSCGKEHKWESFKPVTKEFLDFLDAYDTSENRPA